MGDSLARWAVLGHDLPRVCRLGLATRGNSRLKVEDVEHAIGRGLNYLNWCGNPDALSQAVAALGAGRERVAVAAQFQARCRREAETEWKRFLRQLRTDYINALTLYYVESQAEWDALAAPGGVLDFLDERKREGALRLIGLTSHQRKLAAGWAGAGRLDMLMIRYNAAHRGAERDVFPVTAALGMPVVTFTGLRWKALLEPTPEAQPAFRPPTAAECYRFCLANPHVAVALAAPAIRSELDHALTLLDDWTLPSAEELQRLRAHGDRVRRHAAEFW
ncbi:MAG: aldo/keto reductase [Bryobacteraceae bacterium]|nr:aldo/keto reductase [Bryobacteraceae bacterium]